ncbi:MAG: hypothetical protein R3C05_04045 [Pirellulaceae bacterium]
MDWTLSRRQCLAGLTLSLLASPTLQATGLDSVPLYPDDSHSLYRVRMMIEVEGNAEVPKNAITTDATRKLPVKADAVIDYEERLFRDGEHVPQAAGGITTRLPPKARFIRPIRNRACEMKRVA